MAIASDENDLKAVALMPERDENKAMMSICLCWRYLEIILGGLTMLEPQQCMNEQKLKAWYPSKSCQNLTCEALAYSKSGLL